MPTNEDPLPADVRAYLEQIGAPWNQPGKLLAKYPKPKVWKDGDQVRFTGSTAAYQRLGGRWVAVGLGLTDSQINSKRNLRQVPTAAVDPEDDEW